MSDELLRTYAETETKLRPFHEAGKLPHVQVTTEGHAVDGVSFAPYDGAGEAWSDRLYHGMLIRGDTNAPVYFLSEQDRSRILGHIRTHAVDYFNHELGKEMAFYKNNPSLGSKDHLEKIDSQVRWLNGAQNKEKINALIEKMFQNMSSLQNEHPCTMQDWMYEVRCYIGSSRLKWDLNIDQATEALLYHRGSYIDFYAKDRSFFERSFAPLVERIEQEESQLRGRKGSVMER